MEADSTLRADNVYSSKSRFPVPEIIEREMDCLKYNQFSDGNGTNGKASDATNTDIYEIDEDY
jgi:hypothetical protein